MRAFGHGHRVALMLENRPAFFFHWLALNSLGVSVVPVNVELRSAELEYMVGHSEVAVAVAPSRTLSKTSRRAAKAAGREVDHNAPGSVERCPAWLPIAASGSR